MQGGQGFWGTRFHILNMGTTVTIQAHSQSFSAYLLSNYYRPDAALDAEIEREMKQTNPCPQSSRAKEDGAKSKHNVPQ